MRKSIIGTTFITFLACLVACKKDTDSPQSLISGKWNMQSLHYVDYLGSVKEDDTVTTTLSNQVQFNNDGTFMNIYISGPVIDTISGSYSVSGNKLSFSNYHSNYVFLPTPFPLFLPARVDNDVSISNQITQISSTNLVIHSESNLFDSGSNTNTKIITDQYYTK